MARHTGYAASATGRAWIQDHGGHIEDTQDGYAVSFPDRHRNPDVVEAAEVDAALERASEYGTTVVRIWRERGEGWYAATSREEHPGYSYLCQIDELSGQPIACECIASEICHHLGAAITEWRSRGQWAKNDADTMAAWEQTLAMARAKMPHERQEEAW